MSQRLAIRAHRAVTAASILSAAAAASLRLAHPRALHRSTPSLAAAAAPQTVASKGGQPPPPTPVRKAKAGKANVALTVKPRSHREATVKASSSTPATTPSGAKGASGSKAASKTAAETTAKGSAGRARTRLPKPSKKTKPTIPKQRTIRTTPPSPSDPTPPSPFRKVVLGVGARRIVGVSTLDVMSSAGVVVTLPVGLKPAFRPIPERRGTIQSHTDFLHALGRDCASKLKVESWKELWRQSGKIMKGNGLAVKDRRYIMWAMNKYRRGEDPEDFVKPPKPKKTVRGWGPKVQNGKRIRSRRKR